MTLQGGPGRGGVPGEEVETDLQGDQVGLDDRSQRRAAGHLGRGDLIQSLAGPTIAEGGIGSFGPLQGEHRVRWFRRAWASAVSRCPATASPRIRWARAKAKWAIAVPVWSPSPASSARSSARRAVASPRRR